MEGEPRRRRLGYVRVSSEEQRERQTIATQREVLDRYERQHGFAFADVIEDDGVSGMIELEARPGGRKLLDLVRAGADGTSRPIDEVVVYRLDRLGRDTLDILRVVRDLRALGVSVVSATEPLDVTTPSGQFMLTMFAGVASFERATIVQRSVDGSRRLARAGVWMGGIVPYGYRVVGIDSAARLEVSEAIVPGTDLSEADVVRLIYRLCCDGKACSEIADDLNARGIPPAYVRDGRLVIKEAGSGGKRQRAVAGVWSPGRIRNMLVSTTYRGVHQWGRRRKPNAVDGSNGDIGIIERAVPAIVDEASWYTAQRVLSGARIMRRNDTSSRQWLLRGMVRCSLCGLTYVGVYQAGEQRQPKRYYRCSGKHRRQEYGKRAGRCPAKDLSASYLEDAIWADLEQFIRNPGRIIRELADRVEADTHAAASHVDELVSLRRRLAAKDEERNLVISLFRRRHIKPEALDRQLDEIDREEAAISRQVLELDGRMRAAADGAAHLVTVRELLERLAEQMDDAPTWETKRELVGLLVDRIVITTTIDERGRRQAEARARYRFDAVTKAHTDTHAADAYGVIEREYTPPRRYEPGGR